MPADTKLYLYLDPGRLIGDAPWTFDGRQFAGWVPHQVIAYLWPQGPWYWLGSAAGLPDWVVHRLWLGTLFLAAGTGVLWLSRRLGLSLVAALRRGDRLPAHAVRPAVRLADVGDAAAVGRASAGSSAARSSPPPAPAGATPPSPRSSSPRVGAVNAHGAADGRPGARAVADRRRRRRHGHRGGVRSRPRCASAACRSACRCGGSPPSPCRAASGPTCSPTASRWSR